MSLHFDFPHRRSMLALFAAAAIAAVLLPPGGPGVHGVRAAASVNLDQWATRDHAWQNGNFLARWNGWVSPPICASGGGGVSSMCPSLPTSNSGAFPPDPPIPTAPATSIEDQQAAADAELARLSAILAVVVVMAGYSLALAFASHRRRVSLPPTD